MGNEISRSNYERTQSKSSDNLLLSQSYKRPILKRAVTNPERVQQINQESGARIGTRHAWRKQESARQQKIRNYADYHGKLAYNSSYNYYMYYYRNPAYAHQMASSAYQRAYSDVSKQFR